MVSILPGQSNWDLIGQAIGSNISQNLPGAIQQGYNRQMLQNSLQQIKDVAKNQNSSPLDTILSVMQAGAGIPGSEKYIASVLPEILKASQARAFQNVRQPGEEAGQPIQRQALPGFMQQPGQKTLQENKFFPINRGPEEAPGNLPQAATSGEVIPLLNPSEKIKEAKRLLEDSRQAGIPLTPKEAFDQVSQNEADKRLHNQIVEQERGQRVESQSDYGNKAVEFLKKYYPGSNPEIEAIFQKKGEEIAGKGKSEAEINRTLATEAKNFANAIANVEKELDAPRLFNSISRGLNGTYKNFESASSDVRKHLKPLLDLGLYDTARKLLQDKGYGIEERDIIINPLSERSKILLNRVPKIKAGPFEGMERTGFDFERKPVDLNNIKSSLLELKKADPNFSLVLARKYFEDKGYDWREFKNALNELESDGFELTDDQRTQRGNLDTPPLNMLEKLLHSVGIIGR